jgi:AcrR family transcriptional regulator
MASNAAVVKRGRPARLSREKVLLAALSLLESGISEVSVNGVARELNVAPMSLYTHIQNRDDLLLGVSELVLARLTLHLTAPDWRGKVRQWVSQVQGHFGLYPQIAKLVGESRRVSSEWLRIQAQLVGVLEEARLEATELSSTSSILSQAIVMDCILTEAYGDDIGALVAPELQYLSSEHTRRIELVLRNSPPAGHSLLPFVMEQLLLRAGPAKKIKRIKDV